VGDIVRPHGTLDPRDEEAERQARLDELALGTTNVRPLAEGGETPSEAQAAADVDDAIAAARQRAGIGG